MRALALASLCAAGLCVHAAPQSPLPRYCYALAGIMALIAALCYVIAIDPYRDTRSIR